MLRIMYIPVYDIMSANNVKTVKVYFKIIVIWLGHYYRGKQ